MKRSNKNNNQCNDSEHRSVFTGNANATTLLPMYNYNATTSNK